MATNGGEKLDRIREELTCAICHGCLQIPKLLSCNHSYCQQCLVKLHNKSANKLQLECPTCRQTTALPEGKVEALKTNFQLQSLVDIASKEETSQSARSLNTHPQPSQKEALCEKHSKPLEHFCTDCYELLCSKCITAHRGHKFDYIDDHDLQTEVKALRNEVQEVVAKAENMEKQLCASQDEVRANGDQTCEAIEVYFRKAQENLQDRKDNLLSAVRKYTGASRATLTKHSQQIETDKLMLRDGGEGRSDIGFLKSWKGIKKQLKACEQSVSSTAKESESGAKFLHFKGDDAILPALSELGVLNECRREQSGTMYVTIRRIEVGRDGSDMYVHSPHPQVCFGPREPIPGYDILSSPYIGQPACFTSGQGVYVEVPMERNNWKHTRKRLSEPQRASKIPYDITSSLYNQSAESGGEGLYDEVPMTPRPCSTKQAGSSSEPEGHYNLLNPPAQPQLPPESVLPTHAEFYPDSVPPTHAETHLDSVPLTHAESYLGSVPLTRAESYLGSVPRTRSESYLGSVPRTRSESYPGSVPPTHAESYPGSVPPLPPRDYTTIDVKLLSVVGKNQLVSPNSAEQVHPNGVCCDPVYHNIIVTDLHNYCVRLLDENRNLFKKIGKEGKGKGEFNVPVAVVFAGDHFYVADQGNSRIQKFTRTGDFCTMFGQSQIRKPVALAIDPGGSLYVSDEEKKQIHVYHEDKFVRSIGYCRFKGLAGIAFNRRGMLLVADRGENCIWQMTTNGEVVKKIGSDYLNCPYGVAAARNGSITVTESGKHISVFFPDGTKRCLGGSGSDPGMFRLPQHVCINSKGQIIVADAGNERLQIFGFVSIIED